MKQETIFHYKLLKLSNGESVVCSTDDDCQNLTSKTSIHICDPVLITPIRMPRGMTIAETYIMTPWISISDESVFEVPTQQIIVAVDVKEKFKENYINFIETKEEPETLRTLDEREKFVDQVLTLIGKGDNNEENEEDNRSILVPGSRSIH